MRDEQIAAIAAALHGRITKRHYWYANATKIECDDGEAEESEATALYDAGIRATSDAPAGLHRAADDVTATAPSDSGVTPSSDAPAGLGGTTPIEDAIAAARSLVGVWRMGARPEVIEGMIRDLADALGSVNLSEYARLAAEQPEEPEEPRPSAGDIRDAEDLIDREDDGFGTAAAWNILQRRDEWDAYDAAHRAEQPEKGRVLPTRQRPILSIDPEEGRDGR